MNHVVRGNGPTAVKSKLEYLLSGPAKENARETTIGIYKILCQHDEENVNLSQFWEVEDLPNKVNEETSSRISKYEHECITYKDRRYTAQLPLNEDHLKLHKNMNIAI